MLNIGAEMMIARSGEWELRMQHDPPGRDS